MKMIHKKVIIICSAVIVIMMSGMFLSSESAGPVKKVIVFGDSLSDTGNLFNFLQMNGLLVFCPGNSR